MMAVELPDAPARERIEQDLDTTLVVEAAAGTGKTTALIRRILAALKLGRATLDAIVAVTFTESAAGELKLRLRTALEYALNELSPDSIAYQNLRRALPQLEEARIGTIHSLCSDLLRERPVEAHLDPRFEVAAEGAAGQLFAQAFERWFTDQLANPSNGVRRFLRRRPDRSITPRRVLYRAAQALAEWRDFQTPWRRPAFEREPWLDRLVRLVHRLGQFAPDGMPGDALTKALQALARFAHDVERKESIRGSRDHDGLEADFSALRTEFHWKNIGRRNARHQFDRDSVVALRETLRHELQEFCAASDAVLAADLREDLQTMLFKYELLKSAAGKVDFHDLLMQMQVLLVSHPEVRRELQERYTHLYIDEFQDTDPLQAEILLLLAADDPVQADWRAVRPLPGKLFVVGDPKQSIYRFRRADVTLYERVKQQLVACGAEVLHLQVSFRSVPGIQQLVNSAFERRMTEQSQHQAAYVALLPRRPAAPEHPAVVALPVPTPYSDGKWIEIQKQAIERSYPAAVAGFVHWLVHDSGWKLAERDGVEPGPIKAHHVCLLFKRFRAWQTDLTQAYVQALEARQLGHVLVGGSSFHSREEVEAIRNALTAIEWPDDELAVYSTLRGPLLALNDGHLLAWKGRYGRLHPYRTGAVDAPDELQAINGAMTILRDLHRARNRRPVAVTISRLLSATRAHAGLAIWPNGEQALANVTRLMDMARRAEQNGLTSFRAFVLKLQDEAEHGEASEAPILEEGTDGVRLMTVHKAKGLEFPVVVLCDPTASEANENPSRWVDAERRLCALRIARCSPQDLLDNAEAELQRESEEAVRVLYVACTRARDLLVVPVIGDATPDSWTSTLTPAVYPKPEAARHPLEPAPGCPEFGTDALVERPIERPVDSVAPGRHHGRIGEHEVVWWDPNLLNLDVQPRPGLRQQRLLLAETDVAAATAGQVAYTAWQERGRAMREAAATPSLRVATVTELKADDSVVVDTGVAVVQIGARTIRPHGPRFGTLVHTVLAQVALRATPDAVAAQARLCGLILGAPDDEVAAAASMVVHALQHELLQAAAQSSDCRREVPVMLPRPDGSLAEGVIDLAYRTESGWRVVDFKTDVELSGRLEEYRRQVTLYVQAVRAATGLPTTGLLLQV